MFVTAGTSLKLSGKYIVLYFVRASFLSTASNFDALYSNPVTSNIFLSVSAIDMTRNSFASSFVLPVACAALEITHIDSCVGAALKADATVSVFPLLLTLCNVSVSVNVKGVHCTNTRSPLSSCCLAAASSVVILERCAPLTYAVLPIVAVSCASIAL